MRIAVNTILAATLNLTLNFVLIPQYKAVGAVMATVISYMVLFILYQIAIKEDGRQYFAMGKMWMNVLGIAIFGVMFYVARDRWIIRYGLFIVVLTIVFCLRGRINET